MCNKLIKGNDNRLVTKSRLSCYSAHSMFWAAAILTLVLSFIATAESADKGGSLLDDIKQAISDELSRSTSREVEIAGVRVIKGQDVLKSKDKYTITGLNMNGYSGRNRVNFLVNLSIGKDNARVILIEATFDFLADVFVTSRSMTKGAIITGDDYFVTRQKNSKIPSGAVIDVNNLEGKALKVNVGQGVVIRADYITSDLTVKRGQKVEVMVEGDNVTIATHGVLKNDTFIGGSARVLCESSKKEVNGILVNTGLVRVKI